jgi:hypothetical protein
LPKAQRVPLFVLLVCCAVLSCEQPNGAGNTGGGAGNTAGGREEETDPPDPAAYGIDLNAINKKAVAVDEDGYGYENNLLLGYEWQPGSNGGFTYFYKQDSTVSSTHHCELLFDDQYSYVLYRNYLVTCGQAMSEGERLEARTLHPAGQNGEIVVFLRDVTTGALKNYDIYERGIADSSPAKGGKGPASPPYAPFLGTWTDSDGAAYRFNANGTYTLTVNESAVEYSYLVRKNKLITVTHGEIETVNGVEQWKTFPAVSGQSFTASGGNITLTKAGAVLVLTRQDG